MNAITLVGIDIGKHSFHLHGQDAIGHALLRKKFTRAASAASPREFTRVHRCHGIVRRRALAGATDPGAGARRQIDCSAICKTLRARQ